MEAVDQQHLGLGFRVCTSWWQMQDLYGLVFEPKDLEAICRVGDWFLGFEARTCLLRMCLPARNSAQNSKLAYILVRLSPISLKTHSFSVNVPVEQIVVCFD